MRSCSRTHAPSLFGFNDLHDFESITPAGFNQVHGRNGIEIRRVSTYFVGEGDDVKPIVGSHLIQDGQQSFLGLIKFSAEHGSANIDDECHRLLYWTESTRRKVVHEDVPKRLMEHKTK